MKKAYRAAKNFGIRRFTQYALVVNAVGYSLTTY